MTSGPADGMELSEKTRCACLEMIYNMLKTPSVTGVLSLLILNTCPPAGVSRYVQLKVWWPNCTTNFVSAESFMEYAYTYSYNTRQIFFF